MRIKSLYQDGEEITLESYLNKHGITDIQEYINPTTKYIESPILYNNINQGIQLIEKYLGKKIYLLVDCDLDGYTSSAELYMYLKDLDNNTTIEPLIHKGKIHGLDDKEIMEHLISSEPSLLIIPDASGKEEDYKTLVNLGYEILTIDHHNTFDSQYAITINNQLSPNVINKQGSGAIVVHQVLRALDDHFNVKYARLYTDIAMLGNISDVMNMANHYNRTYNYFGFRNIYNQFIQGLIDKFVSGDLTPHKIAFNITPKFNSVIRSDDYELKKDIFLALIGEIDYNEVIDKCASCHNKQKTIVKNTVDDILPLVNDNDKVIVLQYSDIPSAYTGLICGNISGMFNKPCVIVKEDLQGSIRSPIPIQSIFNQCDYVDWCNGHEESAGIQLNDLEGFKEYCNSLELDSDVVYEVIQLFPSDKIPKYLFSEFTDYDELFGQGIPKPQFHIHNIRINSNDIRVMGKNRTTIKFSYKGIDYIKFFVSHDDQDRVYHIDENKDLNIELIAEFQQNIWQGKITPQAIIDKIEVNIKAKKPMSIDDIF